MIMIIQEISSWLEDSATLVIALAMVLLTLFFLLCSWRRWGRWIMEIVKDEQVKGSNIFCQQVGPIFVVQYPSPDAPRLGVSQLTNYLPFWLLPFLSPPSLCVCTKNSVVGGLTGMTSPRYSPIIVICTSLIYMVVQ